LSTQSSQPPETVEEEFSCEGRFIVSMSPADWLTLVALAFSCAALVLTVRGYVPYALACMLLAMLADAFDGIVARAYGWESTFGRYLDGFVDAFNYLVVPSAIFYRLGLSEPVHLFALFVLCATGILRLSVFNQIGNIKVCGGLSYLGLPVFWTQFLVSALFGLRFVLTFAVWSVVCSVSCLAMGMCFIINRPFWKPKSKGLIVGVIAVLVILFVWIGMRGPSVLP